MRYLLLVLVLLSAFLCAQTIYYVKNVYVVRVDSTIGPYTVSQISRAIELAQRSSGAVLILLNTPGGLAESTLQAIQLIGSSPVPVIGYVYPDYGYAWSGGTYLLLSSPIAAMAPHTVIGSCQPVEGLTPINESKVLNAFAEYLATVMASYGRNETYAYLCVERNINLNAYEALKYHVINYIAKDLGELLQEINGTQAIVGGHRMVIIVESPAVVQVEPTLGEMIQMWLMNDVVESVLSLLALFVIIAALATGHPHFAALGVVLFILSVLPFISTSWVWVALFIMGVALLFVGMLSGGYTHGVLEGLGAALIVLSFLSLFPPVQLQGQPIVITNYWTLMGAAFALLSLLVGLVAFIAWKAVSVHLRRPLSERLLTLKGMEGTAVDDIAPGSTGYVIIMGEYWKATARAPVKKGCRVRVVETGSPLLVEPVEIC